TDIPPSGIARRSPPVSPALRDSEMRIYFCASPNGGHGNKRSAATAEIGLTEGASNGCQGDVCMGLEVFLLPALWNSNLLLQILDELPVFTGFLPLPLLKGRQCAS